MVDGASSPGSAVGSAVSADARNAGRTRRAARQGAAHAHAARAAAAARPKQGGTDLVVVVDLRTQRRRAGGGQQVLGIGERAALAQRVRRSSARAGAQAGDGRKPAGRPDGRTDGPALSAAARGRTLDSILAALNDILHGALRSLLSLCCFCKGPLDVPDLGVARVRKPRSRWGCSSASEHGDGSAAQEKDVVSQTTRQGRRVRKGQHRAALRAGGARRHPTRPPPLEPPRPAARPAARGRTAPGRRPAARHGTPEHGPHSQTPPAAAAAQGADLRVRRPAPAPSPPPRRLFSRLFSKQE